MENFERERTMAIPSPNGEVSDYLYVSALIHESLPPNGEASDMEGL